MLATWFHRRKAVQKEKAADAAVRAFWAKYWEVETRMYTSPSNQLRQDIADLTELVQRTVRESITSRAVELSHQLNDRICQLELANAGAATA